MGSRKGTTLSHAPLNPPTSHHHACGPSRQEFLQDLLERLTGGRSVLVVGSAGDGSADIATALARTLADLAQPDQVQPAPFFAPLVAASTGDEDHLNSENLDSLLLRASARTDATAVNAFAHPGSVLPGDGARPGRTFHPGAAPRPGHAIRVVEAAEQLPASSTAAVDSLVSDERLTVAYFVDADALRAPAPDSPLALLRGAWLAGWLDRVDLPELPRSEVRRIILDICPAGTLDDLQIQTLIELAEGRPLIAADLATWARSEPELVPRRYPRAGVDSPYLGPLAPARLAGRATALSPARRRAAVMLAGLSPLPQQTAVQLFGGATIDTLTSLSLALRLPGVDDLVGVSPLTGSALLQAVEPDSGDTWDEVEDRLLGLWHSGYPIGEAATLRLARRIIRAGGVVDPDRAQLLVDAARIANRTGSPIEAMAFLRGLSAGPGAEVPDSLGTEAPDSPGQPPVLTKLTAQVELQRLTSLLIRGEYRAALRLAEAAIARVSLTMAGGSSPDMELVYTVATTIAWAGSEATGPVGRRVTVPGWWAEFLGGPIARAYPGAESVLGAFTGTGRIDPLAAQRVADNPNAPIALRVSALTFLCQYHFGRGDVPALEASAAQGSELIAQVLGVRARPLDEHAYAIIWIFGVGVSANFLLAGLETERTRAALAELLQAAAMGIDQAGWAVSASTAWCHGLLRILVGDRGGAARDLDALIAMINPAQLSVGWGMRTSIQRYLRSTLKRFGATFRRPTGPTATAANSRYQLLGALFLGPEFSSEESTPDWMHAMLLHAQVLDGTLSADAAATRLADLSRIGLPGPLALRDHVLALATGTGESLFEVGQRLAAMGFLDAAEHALQHARASFVASRSAKRATAADAVLKEVEAARTGHAVPVQADHSGPVSLTRREAEICKLIAQGLTNVKISQKLFLSVRTVESHVLAARGKLGAPRRADIPRRVLELQAAGLLQTR